MSNGTKSLQLISIQLKDFRCFDQATFDLDSPILLICGSNGIGKTSLLEALHYGCYLRSFRTYLSRDLIALDKDAFFIRLEVRQGDNAQALNHVIQVGFTDNKRLVKINNQTIVSYKDLLSHYRVVSITEDDLSLVKGSPEERRTFIDHAVCMQNKGFIDLLQEYRIVLENRNALLHNTTIDDDLYFVWTKKLWDYTHTIQTERRALLEQFQHTIAMMVSEYFNDAFTISLLYRAKKNSDRSFEYFWNQKPTLFADEIRFKRSLFGAHLDDYDIVLQGKKSRIYGSRGQQKLVVLLVKVAHIKSMIAQKGPAIFLLDDFLTDFDHEYSSLLLHLLLKLDCQLIFTSPCRDSTIESLLCTYSSQVKIISI